MFAFWDILQFDDIYGTFIDVSENDKMSVRLSLSKIMKLVIT